MSKIKDSELELAFSLLRKFTSIAVVSSYLKEKDLTFSAGSWEALLVNRVKPALEAGELDREDIVSLLREVEEHGRQHVLLFRLSASDASLLTNPNELPKLLKKSPYADAFNSPKIVNMPAGQTIVDIRLNTLAKGHELVIKAVEGRFYKRLISKKKDGNFETWLYENVKERAVNVVRVGPDGQVDVRIQSHQRKADYAEEAQKLIDLCVGLIDPLRISQVSITKAKMLLATNPPAFRSRISFGNGILKNKTGSGIRVFGGQESLNLNDDEGIVEGTAAFCKKNQAYCEEVNLYWKPAVENNLPSTAVHTWLSGAINEFTLTSQCDRADYEYVLGQIKLANK